VLTESAILPRPLADSTRRERAVNSFNWNRFWAGFSTVFGIIAAFIVAASAALDKVPGTGRPGSTGSDISPWIGAFIIAIISAIVGYVWAKIE
jgi:hypothetical protein